jgi:hypothetical protein
MKRENSMDYKFLQIIYNSSCMALLCQPVVSTYVTYMSTYVTIKYNYCASCKLHQIMI